MNEEIEPSMAAYDAVKKAARESAQRRKEMLERTVGVAPPEIRSTDWLGALARANKALRDLMNCTESMNAHELALACNSTIDLIQEEQARRERT